MKLTGRTRYRIHNTFFKELLVLQVEKTYRHPGDSVYDLSYDVVKWYDSTFEDLQELDEKS